MSNRKSKTCPRSRSLTVGQPHNTQQAALSPALDTILERLDRARQNGSGWSARCPAHDDQRNSLSISISEREGKILLHCFAGCDVKAIAGALGLSMSDLFLVPKAKEARRPVAAYDYTDDAGKLLYQKVRYDPKEFKQRRPDGKGGWVWHLDCEKSEKCKCNPKLPPLRRVLYRLPNVIAADQVLIVAGEKDAETAERCGYVATTNSGGEGKWSHTPDAAKQLAGKSAIVIADADAPGLAHGREVASSCLPGCASVKLIEALPGNNVKDLSDFRAIFPDDATCRTVLDALIEDTPILTAAEVAKWNTPAPAGARSKNGKDGDEDEDKDNPWVAARDVSDEEEEETDTEFLVPPVLARGNLSTVSGPHGIGKTNWARFAAVTVARSGNRVLYLDRDNPRRTIEKALRAWGGNKTAILKCGGVLKLMGRQDVPPLLGREKAWANFPVSDYDLVVLDSWDSTAEGTGEQDSRLPSRAISQILDIVHRDNGPACLKLMNTVRAGTHGRGNGVVEDRDDAVFQVRDITEVAFSGSKPWSEEIPLVAAKDWQIRSSRRKKKDKYRLAFVASKYKILGPEPAPFAIEIDFTTWPYSIRDITDIIDTEGAEALKQAAAETEEAIARGATALKSEIERRAQAGDREILSTEAVEFITDLGVKRNLARQVIKSDVFQMLPSGGKGRSKLVRLRGLEHSGGINDTLAAPASIQGANEGIFAAAHKNGAAEIGGSRTRVNGGYDEPPISAEDFS